MSIHMGNIVCNLLKKQRIPKSEFASLMNYSKQNINALLKKENWYADQILKVSKILNQNLFSSYKSVLKHLPNESSISIHEKIKNDSISDIKKTLQRVADNQDVLIKLLSLKSIKPSQ
jgi:plasmid maintenance system antidote protein VapI